VKFGTEWSGPCAKFQVYRDNVSPLLAKKTFWTTEQTQYATALKNKQKSHHTFSSNFWSNLPLRSEFSSPIFTKLDVGDDVPTPYPHAKFHYCGIRNVGLSQQKFSKYVFLS